MKSHIATATPARTAEPINRAVLDIIADARNRYPSQVQRPNAGADNQVLEQVLELFAQEGVIRMSCNSVALTENGRVAVEQAGRANHRLSEFLRGGQLPAGEAGCSSAVLAILRAHFELRIASCC